MGGVSSKMLTKWLREIPPPEWTKRPRAKDHLRERAVALRVEGKSYREINEVIGVSKSSLSLWLREVPLTPDHQSRLLELTRAAQVKRGDTRRALRVRRTEEIRRQAKAEIGMLTDRELFVAGVVAYWAEGAKPKPWCVSERVSFMNSDPALIRLFVSWLSSLGIGTDRLSFRVQIHESAHPDEAVRFWSGVVGVPSGRFNKTTIKRHKPKTTRKNVGASYHGCLAVNVRRSTDLNRRIVGWWEGIASGLEDLSEP